MVYRTIQIQKSSLKFTVKTQLKLYFQESAVFWVPKGIVDVSI